MKTTPFLLSPLLLCITIFLEAATARPSVSSTNNTSATLPFDTLPNSNCSAPAVCGQVNGAKIQCRCDDTITVCYNDQQQYCWGSRTLHQNTGCPPIPDACSSRFNSAVSCLCNASNVLCVDQHRHACYGSIQGSNVSLLPLGGLSPPPSTSSAISSSIIATSTSSASQSKGTLAATSTPIPNNGSSLSPFLLPLVLPFLYIVTLTIL